MSARTSPLNVFPSENSFAIVASRLTYLGLSRTPLRAALPQVLFGGAEKTDVSNHSASGPMAPSTAGVALTFGRQVLPGAFRFAPLFIENPIGDPDCAVTKPLTCQPPRIWLTAPSFSHFCPGPTGS